MTFNCKEEHCQFNCLLDLRLPSLFAASSDDIIAWCVAHGLHGTDPVCPNCNQNAAGGTATTDGHALLWLLLATQFVWM